MTRPTRHLQHGAASLVVVMVLFFIVAMVAAYSSRNLVFEQRTSVNQYRSTQALEAAEAGLEWALAQLNHGSIDGSCLTSSSGSDNTFRQRYLNGLTTGVYEPRGYVRTSTSIIFATCAHQNNGSWSCTCPSTTSATATLPAAGDDGAVHPAFRVVMRLPTSQRSGVIRLTSYACTRLDNACLTPPSGDWLLTTPQGWGNASDGRALVSALVSMAGTVAAPPKATLTALGDVSLAAASGQIANPDTGSGLAVQAKGNLDTGSLQLLGPAGTPAAGAVVSSDSSLNLGAITLSVDGSTESRSAEDRFFAATFNVWPETFKEQPAIVQLSCASGACTVAQVKAAMDAHPGRPVWVQGDLNWNTDVALPDPTLPKNSGSEPFLPALLVVEGQVNLAVSAPNQWFTGLLYVRRPASSSGAASWTWSAGSGGLKVKGAVVVEGSASLGGPLVWVYDKDTMRALRYGTGSLVRVPGGWKDFP